MVFAQHLIMVGARCRALLGALLGLALVGFAAGRVEAQLADSGGLVVVPVVGALEPKGEMGTFLRGGPTFGLQLMYQLSPRLAVGVEGAYDSHMERTVHTTWFSGPPTFVARYGVTGEFALLPPAPGRFTVVAGAGAGFATMFSDELFNPFADATGEVGAPDGHVFSGEPLQFDGTYASFNGLARVGYVASRSITLFLEGAVVAVPSVDEEKAIVFVIGDPTLEAPGSWTSIGLRLGLRKAMF